MLNRNTFVDLCTSAIIKTRRKISIRNQVSGYSKYHKEIKENGYFKKYRSIMKNNEKKYGYSIFYQHDLIEHAGLGNCHELAEYLSVEILNLLRVHDADARIRIVSSTETDHVFLHVKIQLEGEKEASLWEIDAWDPRIIDASMRPDGTIKNRDILRYGTSVHLEHAVSTRESRSSKKRFSLFAFPKPMEGKPLKAATPERDILRKHEDIYIDHSLEDAYACGELNADGQLTYPQQVSSWQIENTMRIDTA